MSLTQQNLQLTSRSTIKDPLLYEASLLALPVVVSLINLLLPGLFNLAAWMEDYESPSVRTYVAIGRYEYWMFEVSLFRATLSHLGSHKSHVLELTVVDLRLLLLKSVTHSSTDNGATVAHESCFLASLLSISKASSI